MAGETATFTVDASGMAPLSYKWQENGVDIVGAASSSYTTQATTLADSGEQFAVVVSHALGNVTSNAATATITQHPSPATYYVDFISGSDSNNGVAKDTPWRQAPGMSDCTLNCSSIALNPGDSVIFRGGVAWTESTFPMVLSWSGTIGNPIYYGVDQTWFTGNSWTRPVFDLSGTVWTVAPVLADSVNFVIFDNIEIKNEQVDSLNYWPPRGSISVNGGTNITIQNCYIHGWSIQNATVGSDSNPFGGIAFYNNSLGGVVNNCTLDGSPASDSGTGIYDGTIIRRNIIEKMPNGIVIADQEAGLDVSGNQVFNMTNSVDLAKRQNSILVFGSANIYNNLVHDLVATASAINLESPSDAGGTQYVYNNLIWNVGNDPAVVIGQDGGVDIYNNTLNGGGTGCIRVLPNISANLTVENNQCISDQVNAPAWCWNAAGGNAACGSVSTLTFANNVLMTTATAASQGYNLADSFQPMASNDGTVGIGLNLTSICGSTGSSLCSDRVGVARPGGSSAWDAGAYMYQALAGSAPPLLTTQPASQSILVGQAATFSVLATGIAPLSYQWRKDGTNIAGATSSSYTTPATTVSDNGALFSVAVSNATSSVASSAAILTVNAGPGQLTPSTPSLSFGYVGVGSITSLGMTLTSYGNSIVNISGIVVSGSGFNAYGAPAGLILAPGQTTTLNVTFAPVAAGSATGSVTVISDATNSPVTISLSGSGIPPHSVTLSWVASTPSVAGYYVYRGAQTGGPYMKLNSTPVATTQYTDIGVQSGQTYFYVVTSVDSTNVESSHSDEVSATIPIP